MAALEGVEHIIHAGDMGAPAVIDALRRISPVTAIRGDADVGYWAREFPKTAVAKVGGLLIYVIHNILDLDLDPRAAELSAVVYGHSHSAMQHVRDGVLYFNPGSAGPRRFHLPISVGCLMIDDSVKTGEIVTL